MNAWLTGEDKPNPNRSVMAGPVKLKGSFDPHFHAAGVELNQSGSRLELERARLTVWSKISGCCSTGSTARRMRSANWPRKFATTETRDG